ncbi:uncharacterized protein LOC131314831 isoform X2 [Rhododendron vialii]|uniref:uncharacterized protein LOC131314831 isoform X2 n=1 Tax=Rhododendron vialii TaxID=182163 RepID=UPI00265EC1F3|nr:uncharacterized protein LOC131314831 isoform X2 [Rhododendron vialii]XP_058199686.1 uncharacterized protein LOC131314831 isoform X2 [Rhododendron vialii]
MSFSAVLNSSVEQLSKMDSKMGKALCQAWAAPLLLEGFQATAKRYNLSKKETPGLLSAIIKQRVNGTCIREAQPLRERNVGVVLREERDMNVIHIGEGGNLGSRKTESKL